MKRLNIFAFFLVCTFLFCSSCVSAPNNTSAVSSNVTASPSASPVANVQNANAGPQEAAENVVETDPEESEDSEDEGEKEAEKFWATYAPNCSGITYMKSGRQGFIELKGYRINMGYFPITQADQLNGIEARGMATVKTDVYRSFYDSKWHEWKSGASLSNIGMSADFQRYKGQWRFTGGAYFDRFTQPMNCSELPSSSSTENSLLRFDGLYRAYAEDLDPKDEATYWIKFYQDGTVSALAHQNAGYKNAGSYWTVRKVWDCLVSRNQGQPCVPQVSQGTYSISGSTVECEVAGKTGSVKDILSIKENSLEIQLNSKSGGNQPHRTYEFIELNTR